MKSKDPGRPEEMKTRGDTEGLRVKADLGFADQAESVRLRTMAEPEGRRSPAEPEGWTVEAKLEIRKSEAEPG